MALTNSGTAVYLVDSNLPDSYTRPTVTKFTDHEYKYTDAVMTIAKSGVEDSTSLLTFAALVTAVTAAVTTMITEDFDTVGLTVACYANLKTVSSNFNLSGVMYTDGAINYLCTVDIFVKTSSL
jgi:hypothetical protein